MRSRSPLLKHVGFLLVVALLAAACSSGEASAPEPRPLSDFDLTGLSLTVGSKEFVEQIVLGQITIQALELAGAEVNDQTGLEGTRAAREALDAGAIDLYPEYNGTCWTFFFPEEDRPDDPAEMTKRCAEYDRDENDVRWLGRAPLNDTYGFAVAPALAASDGPFDIDTMAAYLEANRDARLCGAREFLERPDGLARFETATGYTVPESQIVVLDLATIYRETADDRCDFGEVFTTDGRIDALELELVDDKGAFFVYNPSLTVRGPVFDEYEALEDIAEMILAPLDDATIIELNRRVAVDGENPAVVAHDYLVAAGLTTPEVAAEGPDPSAIEQFTVPPGGDPAVEALQEDLRTLGYYGGLITGVFDTTTLEALRTLQADADITVDGEYGPQTAGIMGALLGRDDQQSILVLQEALTVLGYYDGPLDGDYGPGTRAGIEQVQASAGIAVDGIYNAETANAVLAEFEAARPEPVSVTEPEVPQGGAGGPKDFLERGDEGDDVLELQQRLAELGFRPGDPDGYYGGATEAAVLAFQKYEGLNRDGQAGPQVIAALENPQGEGLLEGLAVPRIEVDLVRQVAFVVLESGTTVLNVSTGSGETYQDAAGRDTLAYTPTGQFVVERRIDGIREAPLGSLYKPLYFIEGWAIHGAASVPAYPASHGCVRTHNWDQDWLAERVDVGIDVAIYDDLRDPAATTPVEAEPGF